MTEKILKKITPEKIENFYQGNIYPVIICLTVLFGSLSGLEVYFYFPFVIMSAGALILCKSIKPFLISLLTIYMQISVKNSPFYPARSDYLFTGWRIYAAASLTVILVASIIFFVIRNKIYKRISIESTPLLIPALILSVAFLLNGAFSSGWSFSGLAFGGANVLVYLFLFLLIYHGFSENDTPCKLIKYFSYISALIAVVISAELIHLFLTNENIISGGTINKTEVALGWGIWNLIGVSLAVLIPVIFYGMTVGKYPFLYFAAATLAFVMSVLTMSRNALIFSTLIYAVCVLIFCFKGKFKKQFRIITAVGIVAVILFAVLFWDKIQTLLSDYFERGFSDNGRFDIWRAAFANFVKSPIFGSGFYSLSVENFYSFGPVPLMAHNTVLELLSAMGLFGLLAYICYAAAICRPIFCRPTLMKTMLALSLATLMAESMLDNFVFNFYPMFYFSAAAAIIFKADSEKCPDTRNSQT